MCCLVWFAIKYRSLLFSKSQAILINNDQCHIHSYHSREEANPRFREQMEDQIVVITELGQDKSCTLFAIFDGHGGKIVAEHAA